MDLNLMTISEAVRGLKLAARAIDDKEAERGFLAAVALLENHVQEHGYRAFGPDDPIMADIMASIRGDNAPDMRKETMCHEKDH